MSDFVTLIPYYSVAPYGVTFFSRPEHGYNHSVSENSLKNLEDNTNYYGDLSPQAQKRLRKKINFMLYLSKVKSLQGKELLEKSTDFTIEKVKGKKYQSKIDFRLTFITLTLPSKQIHSDNEIKKKCLNQFLVELRKKITNAMYIWKAEKQDNGNIHFHILFNSYVKWQWIREVWNRIVEKLGYVSRYSETQKAFFAKGFKMSDNYRDKRTYEQQFKAYKEGLSSQWTNPNSTDIHALYKVKHLGAYISKYISKGVTKTDRTEKIDLLLSQKSKIENAITEINSHLNKTFVPDFSDNEINLQLKQYHQELNKIHSELKLLKSQGVEGRIWSCSSNLSKLKNYTEAGNIDSLPDIKIVDEIIENVIHNEIGNQTVTTVIFDILKTPQLNRLLHNHLKNSS